MAGSGRVMARLTINFGLVSVPVALHAAVGDGKTKLRTLHTCGTPVKQTYRCPSCDVDAPRDQTVRGIEVAPGEFVQVSAEELEAIAPERAKAVEVVEFVPAGELPAVFLERTYYLEAAAEKPQARAYALLREAMRQTDSAAVVRFTLWGSEHLGLVSVDGGALLLHLLHWAEDVRDAFAGPELEASDAEADMAAQLVRAMRVDRLDVGKYESGQRRKLEELVAARGGQARPAAGPAAPVVDITEKLRQSIAEAKRKPKTKSAPRRRAKEVA